MPSREAKKLESPCPTQPKLLFDHYLPIRYRDAVLPACNAWNILIRAASKLAVTALALTHRIKSSTRRRNLDLKLFRIPRAQPFVATTRIIQSVTSAILAYCTRNSLRTMKLDDWLTRLVAVPPGRSPLANGLAIGMRIALFILVPLGIIAAIAIVLLHR